MDVGWPVLNVWLAEAKKSQDYAVLVEVMQVCVYIMYTCTFMWTYKVLPTVSYVYIFLCTRVFRQCSTKKQVVYMYYVHTVCVCV